MKNTEARKKIIDNSFLTIVNGKEERVVRLNTAIEIVKQWGRATITIDPTEIEEIAIGMERETLERFDRGKFELVLQRTIEDLNDEPYQQVFRDLIVMHLKECAKL